MLQVWHCYYWKQQIMLQVLLKAEFEGTYSHISLRFARDKTWLLPSDQRQNKTCWDLKKQLWIQQGYNRHFNTKCCIQTSNWKVFILYCLPQPLSICKPNGSCEQNFDSQSKQCSNSISKISATRIIFVIETANLIFHCSSLVLLTMVPLKWL